MQHLQAEQRYDWNRILLDLLKCGQTLDMICDATKIPKSTVVGYKNLNVEPKHSDGEQVVALWERHHPGRVAPVVDGSVRIGMRVQSEETSLVQRCPKCGQTMRGALLEKWRQLQMHYSIFQPK